MDNLTKNISDLTLGEFFQSTAEMRSSLLRLIEDNAELRSIYATHEINLKLIEMEYNLSKKIMELDNKIERLSKNRIFNLFFRIFVPGYK